MDEPRPQEVMWNLSHMRVGGDVGGAVAVIGTVAVLVLGIPEVKWFLGAAAVCGAGCALLLSMWHRRRPSPRTPPNTIGAR